MTEYIGIFFLLASTQYPKDDHINLFDHTQFNITVVNPDTDSSFYNIVPTNVMFIEHYDEILLLQEEIVILERLIAEDSIKALNNSTVEYYRDDRK